MARNPRLSILLVDDHQMMRDGLRALLDREGFEVVGEAATGLEALAIARRVLPHVAIMDVSMHGLNGIDTTRRLLAELPATRVIGLSMNSDLRYVAALLDAGAHAYVLKNSASEELIAALDSVAVGSRYISPAIGAVPDDDRPESATPDELRPLPKPLSPRECEVLRLIAEGKSSKDMSARLNVAVATIETYRRQIMTKLGVRTIAELTKFAIRAGLTTID